MAETLRRQPNDTQDEKTPWDDLAEQRTDRVDGPEATEPDKEKYQRETIGLLLQAMDASDSGSDSEVQDALTSFIERSENLWSRDYVTSVMDTIRNRFPDQSIGDESILIQFGMPVRIIVENEDFYQNMVHSKNPVLMPGNISQFYQEMTKMDGNDERFRRDFIEGGLYRDDRSMIIEDLYKNGKIDEASLSDLRIMGQLGVRMFDDSFHASALGFSYGFTEDPKVLSERSKAAYDATTFLIDEGLFSGADYGAVFEDRFDGGLYSLYSSSIAITNSIIKAAIEKDVEIQTENPDVRYWADYSAEHGEDMLTKFQTCSPSEQQKGYDFTQEAVMRAFTKHIGFFRAESYQEPKFREMLRQEKFQDIILESIEKRLESSELNSYTIDSLTGSFLFLAQDREIIEEMRERGAFGQHPGCKKLEAVARMASDEYSEKDRLRLFVDNDSISDESFDESGEPAQEFYVDAMERASRLFFLSDDEMKNLVQTASTTLGSPAKECELLASLGERGRSRAGINEASFLNRCFEEGLFDLIKAQPESTIAKADFDKVALGLINYNTNHIFVDGKKEIDETNIIAALARFIRQDANDWEFASNDDLLIREAFNKKEVKDLALAQLREVYEQYLHSEEPTRFPSSLKMMEKHMRENEGAGPLTQIEAFLGFMGGLSNTGEEIRALTRGIEQRMTKEHWDDQEKTNFYAISAEVLRASPDIYQEFAELFMNLPSKEEFRVFATEIYPLFRAKLALVRDYEDHSNGIGSGYTEIRYKPEDIDTIKNQLHNALLPFNLQEVSPDKRREGISRIRETIFGEISELFREKFGLLPEAIPSELDKADARIVEDMVLYLSNIANPNSSKQGLVGYFLALQFGGGDGWDKVRSGKEVPPRKMMDVVSAFNVSEALSASRMNDPLTQENLRIGDEERLEAFKKALQSETEELRLGDVQTVDLRIQSLIGNIEELTDPDLYPSEIDKQRVELLKRYQVKKVGKVAAGMFQLLSGKNISFTEEEQQVRDEITTVLENNGLEVTPENIKRYFQDGLKGLKEPFGILDSIERTGAREALHELQTLLIPPDSIVKIFNRFGENFSTGSGVMALGADLDYLENIIVKKEDELSADETKEVREYIGKIRSKLAELEKLYDTILQNLDKMKKSIHDGVPSGVHKKLEEIEAIVSRKGEQMPVSTTCTNKMTTIIENMRACLSCKTKGINNDTNLTFGEGYKFYLYSKAGDARSGSTADEVVFFVPSGEGEEQKMSFVMDQVYGNKNRDILLGHIGTMLKKALALKKEFSEVPISIIVPTSTFTSCGTSINAQELGQMLELPDSITISEISSRRVDIPKSGFGDHYVEFGGGWPRIPGERQVNGVEIIV